MWLLNLSTKACHKLKGDGSDSRPAWLISWHTNIQVYVHRYKLRYFSRLRCFLPMLLEMLFYILL